MGRELDRQRVDDDEVHAHHAIAEEIQEDVRRLRGTPDEPDVRTIDVRDRFGGIDLVAILGGLLAGLGAVGLLALLATAAGVAGSGSDAVDPAGLTVAGAVTAAVVVLLGCFLGGCIAARCSRYDGAANGALAALALLVLLGCAVVAGGSTVTDTDGVLGTDLLRGYDTADVGWAVLGGGLGLLLLGAVAGAIGGRIGEGYHRRADRLLATTEAERIAHPMVLDDPQPVERTGGISGRGASDLETSRERQWSGLRMR